MLARLNLLLACCTLSIAVSAQNFSIPLEWQNPTTSLPRSAIEVLASNVVGTLQPLYDPSTGQIPSLIADTADQPAYLAAAISRTDLLSGNTTYKNLVLDNMNTVFSLNPQISSMWGLAAITAYKAYNDSSALNHAVNMWEQISPYQIQPQDASQGFSKSIDSAIPSTCNGLSVAGGVFAYPIGSPIPGSNGGTPTDVDGETVAAFMALSGHLFEATGENQYLSAAQAAATFIQTHMQDGPIIMDTFMVSRCAEKPLAALTYITGFTIWGLSVLSTHDSSWSAFLNSLIATAIPFDTWTSVLNGVVFEGGAGVTSAATDSVEMCLKAVWIRGLHEAWTRLDSGSDAAKFIEAHLYVQFNALINFASTPGSNLYSSLWLGPPQAVLLPWGQLDALDVLNSAFAMIAQSTTSTSSSTNGSSTDSTSSTTGAAAPTSGLPANSASASINSTMTGTGSPGVTQSTQTGSSHRLVFTPLNMIIDIVLFVIIPISTGLL